MRGSASDTAAPAARCRNCRRGSFTGDAPRSWHPCPPTIISKSGVNVCFWHKADITIALNHVRFSNRPVGVKRFQALQYSDGNVARGLVLLYGLGTSARPSWDSKTRWNDLLGGLAVGRSERTCELTSSIVPRGT